LYKADFIANVDEKHSQTALLVKALNYFCFRVREEKVEFNQKGFTFFARHGQDTQ